MLVFLVLYYNLVPISMYVLMEMTNVVQSYYIGQDRDIYYAAEDTAAVCRNSTLCQELGQVDYVFSDKTGTLTQNLREFKKAAVGGTIAVWNLMRHLEH